MTKEHLMLLDFEEIVDAVKALYWYCAHYHSGQNSREYEILSQLNYTPSRLEVGINNDDFSGYVYRKLESKELDIEQVFETIQNLRD